MYTTLFNNSLSSEFHWELNSRTAQELKKLRYESYDEVSSFPSVSWKTSVNQPLASTFKKKRMEKTELIAVALGVSQEHWTLRLHCFQSRDRFQSPVWEISTPITYSAVPVFTNHLISLPRSQRLSSAHPKGSEGRKMKDERPWERGCSFPSSCIIDPLMCLGIILAHGTYTHILISG